MALNWTPEVIVNVIVGIISFSSVVLTFSLFRQKKIRSVLYIRLVIFLLAVYSILESLSDLLLLESLAIMGLIVLFPLAFFTIIAINYVIKDSFFSRGLIIFSAVGSVLIGLTLQYDSFKLVTDDIYIYIANIGYAFVAENFFFGILGGYMIYWAIKTYMNAPFLIKKEASIFFFGLFLAMGVGIILNMLIIFSRIIVIYSIIIAISGAIIFLFAIEREPKLLYILPFIVYRIIVKDKDGYPLYDHDWSDSNINETLFSGFINAVQHMSEEVLDIGGLLDINLEKGMMILHHSRDITVGLVASKSSKMLRESLLNFSKDFETKFQRELKKSIRDMDAYKAAYELIEKHFSNFPYRIFKNKTQPLLINAGKFSQIPKELDNKIREVFKDEKEYEFIKSELLKVPLNTYSEFKDLYDDLEKEMKQLSKTKMNYLDSDEEN